MLARSSARLFARLKELHRIDDPRQFRCSGGNSTAARAQLSRWTPSRGFQGGSFIIVPFLSSLVKPRRT
jgi:hypothetical protein